ncbi:mucin-17-like [Tripterygium wilfordii]|uniref:Mucin-17-like n=1 Tax=Tripterygium wilfordii TaxID=458696 RepID=A0A7J7DWS4_TRIWF|nr:zonadhesin-like isoform X1 [Tripterygium wilfordii]KAF5750840.1 mucin-17-like [Tripterygium wilfordii]
MLTKERDEELALFLEMRRCEMEKEKNNLPSLHDSGELDTVPASNGGISPITKIVSSVPQRKTAVDNFLNSENEKTDFDWLLTPPSTPLFPHLEKDSQKTIMTEIGNANSCPNALRSRFENIPADPAPGSNVAANPTMMSFGLNSSNAGKRRPSSSRARSDVAAKPETMPFGLNFSNTGNRRPSPSATRSSLPAGSQSLPTSAKSSRSSTPTSRATLTSMKPTALPVRSSTPSKATTRCSTPTTRISVTASKTASRSATPTRRPSAPSSAPNVAAPGGCSSSVTKPVPTSSKNPVPSRGCSPNLRTSLPERPASASRIRPGAPSGQSPSVAVSSNGRPRQQSCSPTRGRASYGSVHVAQKNTTAKSRVRTKNIDDVNPVLIGTKMVERVVNMRKLAPPKQDDTRSAHNNLSGKSFGRTLSKKSLDMALRHMDVRKSISGNLRPIVTNIPASSVYSMRSGGSRSGSASDSPRSNASSFEFPVNSISKFSDRNEMESNGCGSNRGNSSPASSLHDR